MAHLQIPCLPNKVFRHYGLWQSTFTSQLNKVVPKPAVHFPAICPQNYNTIICQAIRAVQIKPVIYILESWATLTLTMLSYYSVCNLIQRLNNSDVKKLTQNAVWINRAHFCLVIFVCDYFWQWVIYWVIMSPDLLKRHVRVSHKVSTILWFLNVNCDCTYSWKLSCQGVSTLLTSALLYARRQKQGVRNSTVLWSTLWMWALKSLFCLTSSHQCCENISSDGFCGRKKKSHFNAVKKTSPPNIDSVKKILIWMLWNNFLTSIFWQNLFSPFFGKPCLTLIPFNKSSHSHSCCAKLSPPLSKDFL